MMRRIRMMMNIIKSLASKATINSLVFFIFMVAVSSFCLKYIKSVEAAAKLKHCNTELTAKNKELVARNQELEVQLSSKLKQQKRLADELLQLSEEKANCYKKLVKYDAKFKKVALKAPARVERLVNNHFDRMFSDVAKNTGAPSGKR
jgi:predicted nuclease with TOPRIM domain